MRNDLVCFFCLLCFTFAFFSVSYDQVFSYVSCLCLLDSAKAIFDFQSLDIIDFRGWYDFSFPLLLGWLCLVSDRV